MMVLAHRGFWRQPEEKNTLAAFARAFAAGFGVELDVRDCDGDLVISHDPPRAGALPFKDVLALYRRHGMPGRIAVNIKADGLAAQIAPMIEAHGLTQSCFAFDMSVPDLLSYLAGRLPAFTRHSEYESSPSRLESCAGVWLDAFENAWASEERMREFLALDKQVALVSPELHGKPHLEAWAAWRAALEADGIDVGTDGRIMICTDYPDEVRKFFCGDAMP